MKSQQEIINQILQRDKKAYKDEDAALKKIYALYGSAFSQIYRDIYEFMAEYGDNNTISYNEAIKYLKSNEYRKYIQEIQDICESYDDKEVKDELKKVKSKTKVTRLDSLLNIIGIRLIIAAVGYNKELKDMLFTMYHNEYKDALDDIDVSIELSDNAIDDAISVPWSGATFSYRIWRSNDNLMNLIRQDVVRGIIRGTDIRKVIKEVKNKYNMVKYQAERLVRTESCYIRTESRLDGYKKSKVVEAVEIITAGDDRVCGKCSDTSGVIIPLDKAATGDNIPPLHPSCRCCIVAVTIDSTEE